MKDVKNASTRCFNSSTHKKKWPNNSIKQKKNGEREGKKALFAVERGGRGNCKREDDSVHTTKHEHTHKVVITAIKSHPLKLIDSGALCELKKRKKNRN